MYKIDRRGGTGGVQKSYTRNIPDNFRKKGLYYSEISAILYLLYFLSTFYLILENISTNVRKFSFTCYIWNLWRRVWLVYFFICFVCESKKYFGGKILTLLG